MSAGGDMRLAQEEARLAQPARPPRGPPATPEAKAAQ